MRSPISARLTTRFGPRIPLVAGMLLAAVALFGLSRIGIASGLRSAPCCPPAGPPLTGPR